MNKRIADLKLYKEIKLWKCFLCIIPRKVSNPLGMSKEHSPKTPKKVEHIKKVPYASVIGSLMYAILCKLDICYTIGMVS